MSAVGAQYHQKCYSTFCLPVRPVGSKIGRPSDPHVSDAMQEIFDYLENNRDECQFSLRELANVTENPPSDITIRRKLEEKYGDDIVIGAVSGHPTLVCFRDTGSRLLLDSWYNKEKKEDRREERARVVRAAAAIIREDIRSKVYETDHYPSAENFLEGAESDIPETLNILLEGIILKNKRDSRDKYMTQCISIAHSIISSTRPKSFLSCVLIALGAHLNTRYGSKHLIELLSSLGYCTSYSEATKFQLSSVLHPDTNEASKFSQWVADNADVNICTIDGLSTFHSMGIIESVTPPPASTAFNGIYRVSDVPSATVLGRYGNVPIHIFEKHHESGHAKMETKPIKNLDPILPTASDILWIFGKSREIPNLGGWNGFMEKMYEDNEYSRSTIIARPFINAPPSDYNTIYTTLLYVAEQSKKLKQETCFITFDQPLFLKAHEIVCSSSDPRLKSVVVRLGGFHLLMSFLGAIGFIMSGSGLKELLMLIYAPATVDKMLAGHAYSRAIGGHLLAYLALGKILLKSVDFTSDEQIEMEECLMGILDGHSTTIFPDVEPFTTMVARVVAAIQNIERNGPTAQLWIQYFYMVSLVKQFIEAERSGNWKMHIATIEKMLPFFHASGHFNYASSAQIYLQEMYALEEKMVPREYHMYVSKGFFTIRRSEKFWSGIWSDMTIEQTSMRSMKATGGLTRGRGITDSVLTKWILGMPIMQKVSEGLEAFTDVTSSSTEQHIDIRPSRIQRDNNDVVILSKWFSTYKPLAERKELVSLGDGTVGLPETNCQQARAIGLMSMEQMIGNTYGNVKFSRKNRVQPLSSVTSSIKVHDTTVTIDPALIYQRILFAKKSQEQLKEFFEYELAPFPLSLFDEAGLRKSKKSAIYSLFTPIDDTITSGDVSYVIDGGFLLHKVVWHKGETFSSICDQYIGYIEKYYGANAVVVFDGYPDDITRKSTKSAERLRRSRKVLSAEILFDPSMKAVVSQDKFLNNDRNKSRLISLLKERFESRGISVKQHDEDADVLIVQTALERATNFESVIIVGNDIDLLVILTGIAEPSHRNVFFLKPGQGKVAKSLYSSQSCKDDSIRKYILLLHAFTGCDSTSALFNQGKIKVINNLKKRTYVKEAMNAFYDENADPDGIDAAGEKIFVAIYGGQPDEELNTLRYNYFARSVTKSKFNLSSLPASKAAARQHSLRCYHQVQKWLGCEKLFEQWGWKQGPDGLTPVLSLKEPAPQEVLQYISCKCKSGCDGLCGCRKAGLKCSPICYNCHGQSCNNIRTPYDDECEDDYDEDKQDDMTQFLTQTNQFGEPFDPELEYSDATHIDFAAMEESVCEQLLEMDMTEINQPEKSSGSQSSPVAGTFAREQNSEDSQSDLNSSPELVAKKPKLG